MFHALGVVFSEFSLRMLWKDAARVAMATVAVVGVGVVFGWARLPIYLPERLEIVVQLVQVALGCLLIAWPALKLTGAISNDEWQTIFRAVLPGKKSPPVPEPSL
jgi:hypothetical protein